MTDIATRFTDEVIRALVEHVLNAPQSIAHIPLLRNALVDGTTESALTESTLRHLRNALSDSDCAPIGAETALINRYGRALDTPDHYRQYIGTDDGYYVAPNKRFMAALRQMPQRFGPGARVLDLGAGTGRNGLVAALAGASVDLVERSFAGCQFAARQTDELHLADRVEIHCTDMVDWAPTHHYDAILAITVLEHVATSQRADLALKMQTWLNPGGVVVATAFLADDPGAIHDSTVTHSETAEHVESYLEPGELRQLFGRVTLVESFEHRKLDTSHGAPHYHSVAELIGRNDD